MFWKHLFSWLVIGLFALAAAARAQSFVPQAGPELVANAFTQGAQSKPALAVRADDAFVAAWRDGGDLPGGIKARLFDAAGAPKGPEIWVDQSGVPSDGPRIGCAVDGGFAVAWSDGQDVWVRRFDRGGGPLGARLRVNDPGRTSFLPDLAMSPGGAFVVLWRQLGPGDHNAVFAARFDDQGGRTGNPFLVSPDILTPIFTPRLAIATEGDFLAVWETGNQILARRFGPLAPDAPPAVRVDGPQNDKNLELAPPLLRLDGTGTVVWVSGRGLLGRRLDAAGAPIGDAASLISSQGLGTPLATAADSAGNTVVAGGTFRVMGVVLDRDLAQASDQFLLGRNYSPESDPALAARYSGGFMAMWTSGITPATPYPGVVVVSTDGDSLAVAGQLFGPIQCPPGSDRLCLGPNGRFKAGISWKDPTSGNTGVAHPVHLTPDTGAFWFFSATNLELMVKVVNGTGLNGDFWVYTGALSNVEYTLTVTDTVTGAERSYYNPPSRFGNVADVNAFAVPGFIPLVEEPPSPVLQEVSFETCENQGPLPRALCFQNERFKAVVDFKNPLTGATGSAVSVSLSPDTGVFWFFGDANLELMVKLLDGRAVNGKFWFFYGALSDVEYTITVYDSKTGGSRVYHNPQGTLASGADINAFSP
jgi:hypothetical protein